jgi:hypothetical protein
MLQQLKKNKKTVVVQHQLFHSQKPKMKEDKKY